MGPAIDLTNGNPLLKAMDPEELRRRAGIQPDVPPAAAPAAPSPLIDASKPRPIAFPPVAQMAEAPPTLRTSAGPIPAATGMESRLPSSTADINATPPPPYQRGTPGGEQAEMNRLATTGSGISQIKNPWGRIPLQVLDALGRGLFPGIEMGIPGTSGHHDVLMHQERGRLADVENGENQVTKRAQEEAQTHLTTARANEVENPNPLEDELTEAKIEHLQNPATAATRQPKVIKDSDGYLYRDSGDGEPVPLIVNGEHMKGPMPTPASAKPLGDKAAYQALRAKENMGVILTPEEAAQKKAFEQTIQTTMTDPGVARMTALAQSRIVPVTGENGAVTYDTAGHAVKAGAQSPQSIPFQTEKGVQKAFTSGAPANTLTAFNTAIAHLGTLEQAGKALGNGDVQLLNRLGQEWAKQTGSPAPTNFEAVKSALKGEIGAAFRKGQTTEGESRELDKSIDKIQSPEQLAGVARQFTTLLGSKRDQLKKQYEQGKQGQPNFGEQNGVPAEGGTFNGHKVLKVTKVD